MAESERQDVAGIIHEHVWGKEFPSDEADCCADALLASDWMAAHDERVRADERRVLAAQARACSPWGCALNVRAIESDAYTDDDWRAVSCPTCKQPAGQTCVTAGGDHIPEGAPSHLARSKQATA